MIARIFHMLRLAISGEFVRHLILVIAILFALGASRVPAGAADIKSIDLSIRNYDLFVTTGLLYDDDLLNDMKQGLSKEIVFAFEIYSIRSFFPDEYIFGKKIVLSLKNDPIKREFVARIKDGTTVTEKRFKDTESMTAWALLSREVKVVNLKELDPATYYVKVSAESRIRKLPPVIKILLFFIPETEFSVWRYSQTFTLPLARITTE